MPKQNRDKVWKYLNEEVESLIKTNDFYALGTKYYEMANFLKEEGRDGAHLKRLGYEMKLKNSIQQLKLMVEPDVVKYVEVLAVPGNSCEACMKVHGKTFLIIKELKRPTLPVEICTHEYGCRCCYAPVVD